MAQQIVIHERELATMRDVRSQKLNAMRAVRGFAMPKKAADIHEQLPALKGRFVGRVVGPIALFFEVR